MKQVTLTSNERSGDPELITRDFVSVKSKLYTKKLPRYPRASSLYKDCMRQLVLLNRFKIEEKEYVKFSNTVVFDIGNSVHFWAQNTKSFISDDFRHVADDNLYPLILKRISSFQPMRPA